MKILLVNPGVYDLNRRLIKQRRIWLPGLTLPHLAALTPPDIEVEIRDEITDDIPEEGDWDLVGLSAMGSGIVRAWELGDRFKSRGKPVVLGGIAATLGGLERSRAHCDSLVVGEAENVWAQVLQDARRGSLQPVYEGPPADLSRLPVPRYDLFNRKKIGRFLPLQAARGCKNRCRFCSVTSFCGGRHRTRPFEQIARDVEAIIGMGFRKIAVVDDSIGVDVEFLKGLCGVLRPFKIQWMSQCTITIARHEDVLGLMAESGCAMVSMGLESLSQENLHSVGKEFNVVDRYKKDIARIRSHGIDVSTEMMIGLDDDGDHVFETVYRFVMDNRISVPRIFIVTPVPGTPLYDEWLEEGKIFDHDYLHYNGARLVFKPKGMTMESLEGNYWQLYARLFTVPAIFRRFLGSRPTRGAFMNLFFLLANFHYLGHIRKRIPPGIV